MAAAHKPPKSIKGRVLHAARLGPWAQLNAMRRMQSGEPVQYIAASLNIAVTTLNRWHALWGDDVAHVVKPIDAAALRRATGALVQLERRMRMLWDMLKAANGPRLHTVVGNMHKHLEESFADARREMAQVTGDGPKYFQARRRQAEDRRAQVLGKACTQCGANPTPTLEQVLPSAVYWR